MSDFFVMPQYASLRGKLVLKAVIYYSKLLGFQNEHNAVSRLYKQTLYKVILYYTMLFIFLTSFAKFWDFF